MRIRFRSSCDQGRKSAMARVTGPLARERKPALMRSPDVLVVAHYA
jgi:hypothetical protein